LTLLTPQVFDRNHALLKLFLTEDKRQLSLAPVGTLELGFEASATDV
jgi:hypothetical protein